MTSIPDEAPEVALSVAAVALARRADELGLVLSPEQRDELARAAVDGALPYLDGVGPDLGWPPLPDPDS